MKQLRDNEETRKTHYEADLQRLADERRQLQEFNDYIKAQDLARKEECLIEKQRLDLAKEAFEQATKSANEYIET
jgi:hypothetical protein